VTSGSGEVVERVLRSILRTPEASCVRSLSAPKS